MKRCMAAIVIMMIIVAGVITWNAVGMAVSAPASPPADVTATPIGSSEVQLTWVPPAHATRYTIWRITGRSSWHDRFNGSSTLYTVSAVSGTTYTDTGVNPNTTYTYWVQPYANVLVGGDENGPHSAGVTITMP